MTRSARWRRLIESLKIRTRDLRILPLRLNYPQERLWNVVAPKIDRGEPIRVICLKARREGISTLIEALLVAFVTESDYVQALVTAHLKRSSEKIWQMSRRYVETSDVLAALATVGANSITMGHSMLEVTTAGSPDTERGGDLTAWHGSEAAYFPYADVMTATMQSLPDDPTIFSMAFLESTANGKVSEGRLFYEEWQRAQSGESGWTPLFIACHEMPSYRLPGARVEQLTAEERELKIRFEVDDAFLAWRRAKIAGDLRGNVDKFHQEYPTYPEEAFIQSGLPFFRPAELLPLEKALRPGKKYTITPEGKLTEDPQGYLEIWKLPEAGHTYVCGADSSMGLSAEDDDDDRDTHSRSAAEVIDMETMEQVAEYDAASAPHIMARHLAGIGRLYHEALLAPEIQSSGGGGGRELLVYLYKDLEYYNIHRWTRNDDRIQPHEAIVYGWECLTPSSRVLTSDLRWIPAGDVDVDDELIGCEEVSPGQSSNRLRVQRVLARKDFEARLVEVRLANGQVTRVSANHPFWAHREPWNSWRWIMAEQLLVGDVVRWIPTWDSLRSYEAGQLSGYLDGEGYLSWGSTLCLRMTQSVGPLADEMFGLWSELGFAATARIEDRSHLNHKPMVISGPTATTEALRVLGSVRPKRLLRKFMERKYVERMTVRSLERVAVESVRPIGEGPVVGLTTDPDHTLIADGILGHNTNSRTRPRMLARMREVVDEKCATIHSRRLFGQLTAFGENDSGRLSALSGHDDLLFAWGIAIMSRTENYFEEPKKVVTPNWPDLGIRFVNGLAPTGEEVIQRILSTPIEGPRRSFLDY